MIEGSTARETKFEARRPCVQVETNTYLCCHSHMGVISSDIHDFYIGPEN